jgi:hypothetical protein
MSEQHGFRITVEVIEHGSYEDAFRAAMAAADSLYAIVETGSVLVTETGESLLSGPDGVFCEGCEGHVFPGVRWPTTVNADSSREWVERCDRCDRYESDGDAAQAVRHSYPTDAVSAWGEARPHGSMRLQPYVEIGG